MSDQAMTERYKEVQETVAENVLERRGLGDGWDDQQLIARNVIKLQEELAEMARYCILPARVRARIVNVGNESRESYRDDDRDIWAAGGVMRLPDVPEEEFAEAAMQELADVIVVSLVLSALLDREYDDDFIGIDRAIRKSVADISRGQNG